ncbi:MAG: hypothetical protein ACYDFT_05935 [Thermoplasmata archaeon]
MAILPMVGRWRRSGRRWDDAIGPHGSAIRGRRLKGLNRRPPSCPSNGMHHDRGDARRGRGTVQPPCGPEPRPPQ